MAVLPFTRRKFPADPSACLDRLAAHARKGSIVGIAFVCITSNGAPIADTCGAASDDPEQTRRLLRAFEAKLAKKAISARS